MRLFVRVAAKAACRTMVPGWNGWVLGQHVVCCCADVAGHEGARHFRHDRRYNDSYLDIRFMGYS